MVQRSWVVMVAVLAAGCASRPAPAPVSIAEAPVPVAPPALPLGATPGMLVPVALADGSYPTPNQHLSGAAAVWHLRSGLNVAALACPAEQGAAITAAYNTLLATHRAELQMAEASYAAEYRSSGDAGWRDRYDDAMTRLYNFFSQTPVRSAFCGAAVEVVGKIATVPAGGVRAVAAAELGRLDRPFADFYRAYDAWRTASLEQPVIAVVASAPAAVPPPASPQASQRAVPATAAVRRIDIDLSKLPSDSLSGA